MDEELEPTFSETWARFESGVGVLWREMIVFPLTHFIKRLFLRIIPLLERMKPNANSTEGE